LRFVGWGGECLREVEVEVEVDGVVSSLIADFVERVLYCCRCTVPGRHLDFEEY
jgi:hypothetical protein